MSMGILWARCYCIRAEMLRHFLAASIVLQMSLLKDIKRTVLFLHSLFCGCYGVSLKMKLEFYKSKEVNFAQFTPLWLLLYPKVIFGVLLLIITNVWEHLLHVNLWDWSKRVAGTLVTQMCLRQPFLACKLFLHARARTSTTERYEFLYCHKPLYLIIQLLLFNVKLFYFAVIKQKI